MSVRFTEVCDPHHALSVLHKLRQSKRETAQAYAERLYTLAHDAFTQLDKAVVESQLVGFFIEGLYHNYLWMEIMSENPKMFQATVQSALAEQYPRKKFNLRSDEKEGPLDRLRNKWKLIIFILKRFFLCKKVGHMAKYCHIRSINAVHSIKPSETHNVC